MRARIGGWCVAIMVALLACMQPAAAQLEVGRDYVPIVPAQGTSDPGKVEVIEFFSYGCPHCNEFHPIVSKWSAGLPRDVVFKRVPVSFGRPQWEMLSQLYYALEATGDLARLDGAVFKAAHDGSTKLADEKNMMEWVKGQGIDAQKFSQAYKSFGVVAKVKRAEQMVEDYKVQGVPALIVEGKYMVVGKATKGFPDLVALTDQVIAKARSERGKK